MEQNELKPIEVFRYFSEICRIPRASKKEEKMIEYLLQFAKAHQLDAKRDATGNVLISKAATPGMEQLKTTILQCHMDMVCEKNGTSNHDFAKDPIETIVENGWMHANGTTLGADDGIGIATALAILAANDIPHGPLECVFTEDEETGMTGAFNMAPDFMSGEILLNLDSEDEGEMFIGCAGGANSVATYHYDCVDVPQGYFCFNVGVRRLTGGHSGDDINKKRANANKLITRLLGKLESKYDFYLCQIDGGNLHNAIPREATALCAVPMKDKENVRVDLNVFAHDVENEFAVTEPNVEFWMESAPFCAQAIDRDLTSRMLLALTACFNGVFAMSQDIDNLVETSNNLASIKMKPGQNIEVLCSQRSSIASCREHVSDTVCAAFRLSGATVEVGDGYPGWKPNANSPILKIVVESYTRLFGHEPKVKAIHAGLECGLFFEKYPYMDMVSFGPTLRGVHSPDERLELVTVDMFWRHLLDVLKNIPNK